MGTRSKRVLARVMIMGALVTALALPLATAHAAETFYRFEEVAQANWTVEQDCGDGTSATYSVSVFGGLEFESPDLDDVNEFVTVRIRSFADCDGEFVNEFGTGSADYDSSPSLRQASVAGTVTLRSGDQATIDVTWTATGPLQTNVNTTRFPGFSGVFIGREREAAATGTVTVGGDVLVDGPAQSATIETLEDRNISTGRSD